MPTEQQNESATIVQTPQAGELVRGPARGVVDDGHRGRRRWWIVALVGLVAMTVVGFVAGRQVQSADQAASLAAPPDPSWITADVERRVLAQTVITRGDVRPEVAITVDVPSSAEGEPIVTALGPPVGETAVEGTRLVEVSGRPVFVLEGAVPVHRSLRPGMTGGDVSQMQAALNRLGCDTAADGNVYGAATKACVAAFYVDAGYEPIPTSPTEAADLAVAERAVGDADAAVAGAQLALDQAGRGPSEQDVLTATTSRDAANRARSDTNASSDAAVALADANRGRAHAELDRQAADPAALPGDVEAARAGVEQADAAAAQARRDRDSNIAAANDAVVLAQATLDALNAPADVTVEQAALAQAIGSRDQTQISLDTLRATTGATVPQGEIVFAPRLPARVQHAATALGGLDSGAVDGGTETPGLVTLAAGDLVVTSTVRPGERDLVRVGMAVELLDEQTNTSYPATIATISDTQTNGDDGQIGLPMTIHADEPLPDQLAQTNLRVTITAASTDTDALVVPLAAISSSADGSTNVSVLGPDEEPEVVPVVAGISADGFVAIEPLDADSLTEGDRVVVGR